MSLFIFAVCANGLEISTELTKWKPQNWFQMYGHTHAHTTHINVMFASMCVFAWLLLCHLWSKWIKTYKNSKKIRSAIHFVSISLVSAFQSISFCNRETKWQYNMEVLINRSNIVYTLYLCIAVNIAFPSSISLCLCPSLSLSLCKHYKNLISLDVASISGERASEQKHEQASKQACN